MALYPEVFVLFCTCRTRLNMDIRRTKGKGMRFEKFPLINIGLAIVKRDLVSVYRICRRPSLVTRSRVRQAVPMDVSSDRSSKL